MAPLRMSGDALKLLRQSHKTLSDLAVPHGLIGGWAVAAWGRVRVTRDLDWLADIPPSRRKEALAALTAFGKPEWRPPGQDDPVAGGLIRVVPKREADAAIDVVLVAGAADRIALSRCVPVDLGAGSLPAVRPEDIIAMKLQAGGPVDLDDARGLLQVQTGRLDEGILSEACRSRRVTLLLKKIRGGAV